jgi:hypothetical protein
MPYWAAVIIAFVAGGMFGVVVLSLCVAAGRADAQMEREAKKKMMRLGRLLASVGMPEYAKYMVRRSLEHEERRCSEGVSK